MTYRRRILASVSTALVGLVLVLAAPAGAEDANRIADDGWWWRTQTGLLTELPPPPGVEEGQLLVQSTPDGAQAIAAVSAVLAEGQTNPVLTLDVATDGGGAAAVLLACQAGSAWVGDDAGRWDSRPKVDCTTSVTGIPSDDGTQWTFALGPLQFDDRFNVVLVPGLLADSEAYPSFHLAFEAPTAASITTSAGQGPTPTFPAPTSPPTAPPATTASAPSASFTPSPRTAATVPAATSTPLAPAEPALEPEDQGLTDTAPVLQEAAVAAVEAPEPRTLARVIGTLVLLAGLAGAVVTRRSAALAGAAATPEVPVLGGLARFRSQRTEDPRPVT